MSLLVALRGNAPLRLLTLFYAFMTHKPLSPCSPSNLIVSVLGQMGLFGWGGNRRDGALLPPFPQGVRTSFSRSCTSFMIWAVAYAAGPLVRHFRSDLSGYLSLIFPELVTSGEVAPPWFHPHLRRLHPVCLPLMWLRPIRHPTLLDRLVRHVWVPSCVGNRF